MDIRWILHALFPTVPLCNWSSPSLVRVPKRPNANKQKCAAKSDLSFQHTHGRLPEKDNIISQWLQVKSWRHLINPPKLTTCISGCLRGLPHSVSWAHTWSIGLWEISLGGCTHNVFYFSSFLQSAQSAVKSSWSQGSGRTGSSSSCWDSSWLWSAGWWTSASPFACKVSQCGRTKERGNTEFFLENINGTHEEVLGLSYS